MDELSRRKFLQSVAVGGAILATDGIIFPRRSRAQAGYTWTPVNYQGGGFVTGLVIDPGSGATYARTDVGGLYGLNSSGIWIQLLNAATVPDLTVADYSVSSIAVAASSPTTLYMAAGNFGSIGANPTASATGRVLKSTNSGATWAETGSAKTWQISGDGSYRTGAERLAVDPANANVVYFGTDANGLWQSSDGAATWTLVPTTSIPAPAYPGVRFVLFDPTSGTIGGRTKGIYVGVSGSGIYVSHDAGSTWALDYPNALAPSDAKICNDGTLYVSFWTGKLFRRDKTSGAWAPISTPATTNHILFGVDPNHSNNLVMADNAVQPGTLYVSQNSGASWLAPTYNTYATGHWLGATNQASFMPVGTFVFDPNPSKSGQVWFAEGFGVWRTSNMFSWPVAWYFYSNGIEEMVAQDAIAVQGQLITAVGDWSGFAQSVSSLNLPPSAPTLPTTTPKYTSAGSSVNYAGNNPNFVVAVSSNGNAPYNDSSGYGTISGGSISWQPFAGSSSIPGLYGGNIAVSADADTIFWCPCRKGGSTANPAYSNDNGTTWTQVSSYTGKTGVTKMFSAAAGGWAQSIYLSFQRALDADKVESGTFYIYCSYAPGVFLASTDHGVTWQEKPNAPTTTGVNDVTCIHNQIHAAPGNAGHVWASTNLGLFSSTDHGGTWVQNSEFIWAGAFGFGKAINTYPTMFVYGRTNALPHVYGIYRSVDQGVTWTQCSLYPGGFYSMVQVLTGDMTIAGRVYVGLSGNSFVYGDG